MYGSVVLGVDHHRFEEIIEHAKLDANVIEDTALTADNWRQVVEGYKDLVHQEDRQAVPAGSARAALGRDRRRVRLLDEPAGDHLSPPARHPRRMGHRRQRPGDGVRQHGRRLRHRRLLHPRSVDRREHVLRRVSGERAGRGRRRRHSHAPAAVQCGRQARRNPAREGDAPRLRAN